jgi:hypothetical protein
MTFTTRCLPARLSAAARIRPDPSSTALGLERGPTDTSALPLRQCLNAVPARCLNSRIRPDPVTAMILMPFLVGTKVPVGEPTTLLKIVARPLIRGVFELRSVNHAVLKR